MNINNSNLFKLLLILNIMKKEGKVLALVFVISILLILSISFVSAGLIDDINKWFKKLFETA